MFFKLIEMIALQNKKGCNEALDFYQRSKERLQLYFSRVGFTVFIPGKVKDRNKGFSSGLYFKHRKIYIWRRMQNVC